MRDEVKKTQKLKEIRESFWFFLSWVDQQTCTIYIVFLGVRVGPYRQCMDFAAIREMGIWMKVKGRSGGEVEFERWEDNKMTEKKGKLT